mmetsp:Transcript_105453/g.193418  ORF Transcript_105453/g.193418 Transcript_105453/m.193418 type:complete len:454 (-) Transcript_105453:62-1423(-)
MAAKAWHAGAAQVWHAQLESRALSYPPEHDVPDDTPYFDINDWIYEMWTCMDRDNTGFISRQDVDCEEFNNVIRAILAANAGNASGGASNSRSKVDLDQAISYLLRKADLNSDQKVSFDEFKSFVLCLRNPQLSLHTANLIFALFDTNRDQYVDEAEFHEMYRFYTGRVPARNEFRAEWHRIDVEREGKVDREAYLKWLQTSSNPVFRLHGPLTTPGLLGLGGSTDARSTSSRSGSNAVSDIQRQQVRETSASKPWRPHHAYPNFCWNKVGLKAEKEQREAEKARPAATVNSSQELFSRTDSSASMPRWNHHLTAASPNWMNAVTGKPRRHRYNRTYFSSPQSLPDLHRHYKKNNDKFKFEDHLRRMESPEKEQKRNFVPSHENTQTAGPELLPNRRFTQGHQRNRSTGKREKWKDNFLTPPQLKDSYQPSTTSYRCPGAPPRYMLVDEYYDD